MVFVPTVRAAKIMHMIMNPLVPCYVCTSKTENRDQVIEEFRSEKNGVIIATTVLERGVTVPGADICVFEADSGVFSEASLIQMAGRAGRSFQYPDGDVLFLCTQKKELVFLCRKTIREDNACAA
jgi:competence protein ComFA